MARFVWNARIAAKIIGMCTMTQLATENRASRWRERKTSMRQYIWRYASLSRVSPWCSSNSLPVCVPKTDTHAGERRDGLARSSRCLYTTTIVLDHGGVKRGKNSRTAEGYTGVSGEWSLTHVHRALRVAALRSRRSEAAKPSGWNSRIRVVASLA